jgi:hypothetical protein
MIDVEAALERQTFRNHVLHFWFYLMAGALQTVMKKIKSASRADLVVSGK